MKLKKDMILRLLQPVAEPIFEFSKLFETKKVVELQYPKEPILNRQ